MKWFDRQFKFPFETDIYPGIMERMRGLEPRVRDLLATYRDADWARREGDAWSAQEHLGHICDLEGLFAGRIADFLSGQARLRPADLENRKTHDAGHNARTLDEVVDGLADARSDHVRVLEQLAPSDFGRVANHPRLDQPMRLVDSVFFTVEHDDHHLAAVRRLLRAHD